MQPGRIVSPRRTVEQLSEKRCGQLRYGSNDSLPLEPLKIESIKIIQRPKINPRVRCKVAAEDTKKKSSIRSPVKATGALGSSVGATRQQSSDNVAAFGSRQHDKVLVFPLARR